VAHRVASCDINQGFARLSSSNCLSLLMHADSPGDFVCCLFDRCAAASFAFACLVLHSATDFSIVAGSWEDHHMDACIVGPSPRPRKTIYHIVDRVRRLCCVTANWGGERPLWVAGSTDRRNTF
jgi:hypothetical protein